MPVSVKVFDRSGRVVHQGTSDDRDYVRPGFDTPDPPSRHERYSELAELRARVREADELLAGIKKEPLLMATVVELREDRMSLSFGPGNALDVQRIKEARVGDRVLTTRNTMAAVEVIRDAVPTGTIVVVKAFDKERGMIEAEYLSEKKTYRSSFDHQEGERVILDASLTFVIGSLGKPPADYAFRPKVSVSWDDIGGQEEAKAALREAIELPHAHPELFAAYAKQPCKGVLLEGASGLGKTLIAKAAATSLARAHGETASTGFIYVKGPELLHGIFGKTEERVRQVFAAAREHRAVCGYPAIVFLDECDALLGARDRGTNNTLNATVVPQFLAEMDGLDENAAMVLLATNRADMLDPAVTRDGRIDRKVRVTRPTREDCRAIFAIHLRGRPVHGDLADGAIAEIFDDGRVIRDVGEGLLLRLRDFVSGAMIAGVVERASTLAILGDIEKGRKKPRGISAEDLRRAIDDAQAALRSTSHGEAVKELIEMENAARLARRSS